MSDDIRSILDRSLAEGGMLDGGGPDEHSIARRVRGVRRRRTAAGVAGTAAAAAVALVLVWQAGGFTNDPMPPATPSSTTPTSTTPTDGPTETGTDPSTGEETDPSPDTGTGTSGDPTDWSEAVFPECGEAFSLPDRPSQLVVEGEPGGSLHPGGSWNGTIRNTGSTAIAGQAAMQQQVVVDGDGTVVATIDPSRPDFWGAEGAAVIDIAAGAQMPFTVTGPWSCSDGGLPDGEYETYVLVSVGDPAATDADDLEQAQGGPFPLVVDEGAAQLDPVVQIPAGAQEWSQEACGPYAEPETQTGFELELDPAIRTERGVGDDISGGVARLSTTSSLAGAVLAEVVVVQDGQVVGDLYAGDAGATYYLSDATTIEVPFGSALMDCQGQPLPAGQYEVSVVATLVQFDEGGVRRYALAATDPVEMVLE